MSYLQEASSNGCLLVTGVLLVKQIQVQAQSIFWLIWGISTRIWAKFCNLLHFHMLSLFFRWKYLPLQWRNSFWHQNLDSDIIYIRIRLEYGGLGLQGTSWIHLSKKDEQNLLDIYFFLSAQLPWGSLSHPDSTVLYFSLPFPSIPTGLHYFFWSQVRGALTTPWL